MDFISAAIGGMFNFAGTAMTNAQNAQIAHDQMRAQQVSQANAQEFTFAEQERNRNLQVASQANAQTYANDQANYARNWMVQERLGAQDWQHYQRQDAQNWTQGQREQAQAWQQDQREQVQAWEAGMSNTAYQRSVADMRAAGLNPILGVHGGGASTPSVSPGSISGGQSHAGSSHGGTSPSPTSSAVAGSAGTTGTIQGSSYRAQNAIGEALNTGISIIRALADLRRIDQGIVESEARTDNLNAGTQNTDAQTVLARMRPELIKQELINMGLDADRIKAMTNAQAAAAYASIGAGQSSRAEAGQTSAVTDYFKKTGALPGSSQAVTVAGVLDKGITGVTKDVADYLAKTWDSLWSTIPKGNSAKGNQLPTQAPNFGERGRN